MRNAKDIKLQTAAGTNGATGTLPKSMLQPQSLLSYLLPHQEARLMPATESKGLFLPWPLLAIITTVAVVLISGLVTLTVQVSNLNTTMLLRDADSRAQISKMQDELSTLRVYVQNDRERLVKIETQQEQKRR